MNELMRTVAVENETAIKTCKQNIAANSIELGRRLSLAQTESHWQSLGYDSFDQWLADPRGVDIGKSTAYRLMAVHKKFVGELGMTDGELVGYDTTKLEMLVPYVSPENKEDMVGMLALSRSDLHESLAEKFGKQTSRQQRFEAGFNGGTYLLEAIGGAFAGSVTEGAEELGYIKAFLWKKGSQFFIRAEK